MDARWWGLAPALLLLAVAGPIRAAEPPDEAARIARELHEALGELTSLRRARAAAVETAARDADVIEERIARLRADVERADGQLAAERDRIAELDAAFESARAIGSAARAALREASDRLVPSCGEIAQRIRDGAGPDRAVRSEAFEAVRRALEGSEADRAAAIGRYGEILAEEFRLASSTELDNEVVDVGGGREQHAWTARIGLVARYFVAEDRRVGGRAIPGTEAWELVGDDERERLVHAIDMLRGRRSPGFVVLRVPVVRAVEASVGEEGR